MIFILFLIIGMIVVSIALGNTSVIELETNNKYVTSYQLFMIVMITAVLLIAGVIYFSLRESQMVNR